jgi:hypothetical protein
VEEAMRRPSARLGALLRNVERLARERPYPVLALGVTAGYLAGGGFFSRFTRPMFRAVLAALLVPTVRERARRLMVELMPRERVGAA